VRKNRKYQRLLLLTRIVANILSDEFRISSDKLESLLTIGIPPIVGIVSDLSNTKYRYTLSWNSKRI
jgi:hypothetical protein